jgi:predicted acyl esterase
MATLTRRDLLTGLSSFAATGLLPALAAPNAPAASAAEPDFVVIPTKVYPTPQAPDGLFPVKYRKLLPVNAPRARYPGFKPGTWTLKAGTVRREGARPLPVDIVFERDVPMKLRDGTTIYTDIFRPAGMGRDKVPAIFSWSPYGKALGGQWLDDLPGRSGVPLDRVSELQRFEGADPAYWCAHGYAVVNPDPRGALMSEGNVNYWGRQLAEDGYDFIEWVAAQPWCSGKVVMSGNSWLAVSQWFIAAERPPHLAAIAPWEGLMDQGPASVPAAIVFGEIIIQSLAGKGYVEDQPRMLLENPLMNAFWHDRRARVERIDVPTYVVASYTNLAHTVGTFDAWRHLGAKQKWLRIHNTQEWTDYYDPANVEDLRRFFDHHAKGIDNGWEATPAVRMAVLNPGGADIVNRVETTFPPARAVPRKLFLQGEALRPQPAAAEQQLSHAAADGKTVLLHTFTRDTEISGYMVLRLWLEADGSDDMDLAVSVRKRPGLATRLREKLPGPPDGNAASGLVRVSMRELDAERSTPLNPVLAMRREQRLKAGEVVPVDIALSPMAMRYRAGETLELTLSAFNYPRAIPFDFGQAQVPYPADGLTFAPGHTGEVRLLSGPKEASATRLATTPPPTRNHGRHVIHCGGKYDSHLLFCDVPAA